MIKAMAVFMQKHKDAWLSTAWHNPWQTPGYHEIVELFNSNNSPAIPQKRAVGPGLAALAHAKMPAVYQWADIGLFPNRCEAGNNMPMCEMMAAGKPVIATYATGHKDVLAPGMLNLVESKPLTVNGPDGQPSAIWVEPNLDEVIDRLEWAYSHRAELPALGAVCRERMRAFTWQRCAEHFVKILES